MTVSLFVEELLEQMIEQRLVESNSDAARQGIELLARQHLGEEHVDELKRQLLAGKETPSA